jgi:hypothetical protein
MEKRDEKDHPVKEGAILVLCLVLSNGLDEKPQIPRKYTKCLCAFGRHFAKCSQSALEELSKSSRLPLDILDLQVVFKSALYVMIKSALCCVFRS